MREYETGLVTPKGVVPAIAQVQPDGKCRYYEYTLKDGEYVLGKEITPAAAPVEE